MRNFEIFVSSIICSICIVFTPFQKSLHQDVQAFSDITQSSVILERTEHGGSDYLNKIVFLGDSRTYGLKAFAMLDGGENTQKVWTPKNGTMSIWDMQYQKILFPATKNELTCAEAAALDKPEILVISLGFNGFDMVKKEYFISEYKKLIMSIKQASPTTNIILQSMFPVCRTYEQTSNERIIVGNEWILSVAQDTSCHYLNTAEILCDNEGFLIEEYSTDGCHLTPLGLDVQLEYVCTHMIEGE